MRAVIQRVSRAKVEIVGKSEYAECSVPSVSGEISRGLLVLAAVENSDSESDAEWLASKIVNLRIFEDSEGKMNLGVSDVKGDILAVSQFTLYGNAKKGSRPSYNRSAPPAVSIPLFGKFREFLELKLGKPVKSGVFGAMMNVSLVNDGPVTIILDSKNREL